jgi:DNA-binding NtrC family response regulator
MAGKKILWIDDDPDLLASLEPLLTMEGWEVQTANSAEEGKEKAVQYKPDLIIMDVIMGGEHGFDAVEDMKASENLSDIPIILYSSVSQRWGQTTATREDAMTTEAAAFVDKSKDPQILVDTVRKFLGE